MIRILYDKTATERDLDSGLMSFINWHTLKPHLERLFNIDPAKEKIVGVKAEQHGITVKIESV